MLRNKFKIQNSILRLRSGLMMSGVEPSKFKIANHKSKIFNFGLPLWILIFGFLTFCLAQEQFIYDDTGKRNPFIPLVTADGRIIDLDKEEKSELRLNGIIYSPGADSYAVVDQTVVKAGDWVGGYRVDKIEENRVLFSRDDEHLELTLD